MKISKGYNNYKIERGDCRGKRLFLAIIPKRYLYILDIDFCYYSLKRFWIEIVFLGIGFSYDTPDSDLYRGGLRFRNDYKR